MTCEYDDCPARGVPAVVRMVPLNPLMQERLACMAHARDQVDPLWVNT